MDLHSRGRTAWLAALGSALVFLVASPLASAAGPSLRAAPLSKEFQAYRAELEVKKAMTFGGALGHGLGLVPEPVDLSLLRGVGDAPRVAREALPSSYDLRALGRLTPVRDQGILGTGWAFATFASMESCLLPGETRDFSEDHIVLTSGFDSGGDPYGAGGNVAKATAYLTRWGGPVDEAADAYGDSSTPPGLTVQKHVQDVLYIPGGSSGADTASIKDAVMTYGALHTAICWESASYLPAQKSFFDSDSGSQTNHAVAIVGWDDTFAASRFASTPAGNGAWLVRNSWGPGWGDGGYFWVSYYDAHCGRSNVLNAAFLGVATRDYDEVYSYDPLGWVYSIGYAFETAWAANVFTATRGQAISAVGFFAPVPGTTYAVYVGGVNADGTPGVLTAKGSGTISTPGFRTIEFSSAHWVPRGSRFAVAVRLTTPGLDYPIACEAAVTDYSSAAQASLGESFLRGAAGEPWGDLTSFDPTANVCLKAYGANDTGKPTTSATAASVKRNSTVTLKFRVSDPLPSCGTATVKIQILKGSKIVKTITVGPRSTNVACTYKWKATLAKGTYSWRASATDAAGNAAKQMTAAKLVIK